MAQKEKNSALKTFRESRPDLEAEFERECETVLGLNEVIKRGPFDLGSGDTDLYQAFAWRNWQLLRVGGRFAVVLPRGALSGAALAEWRRAILHSGSFADVCFLENTGRWAFDMEPRYTIALTVTEKGGERVVRWTGPFSSRADFVAGAEILAEFSGSEFVSWSNSAAFPLIPDPPSAEIFRVMKRSPCFDAVRDDWEFRPLAELHGTGDKDVMEFDVDEPLGRIPVVTGASFNLWNPDAGKPKSFGKPKVLRPFLERKLERASRLARSAYFGVDNTGDLPMDHPRIAFRDMARATDTRTVIVCLLPPGTAAMEKAPVLVQRRGGAWEAAALLGVMSSRPYDWFMRRWVETKLSYELLNPSPIPVIERGIFGSRLVEISGRLAAVDERFQSWASEVGVSVGSVKTSAEKDDLIAELDALVSLLYGLTENQVEHLFATFHRGWKYEPHLEAVLQHYRTWKGKA